MFVRGGGGEVAAKGQWRERWVVRFLVGCGLLVLSAASWAQSTPEKRPVPSQAALKAFTSPNGAFQFSYPAMLIFCELLQQKNSDGYYWAQPECSGYIPACGNPGDLDQPVVCLAYPRNKHSDSPTFDAATFSVWDTTQSEKDCLADSDRPLPPIIIRGVRFKGGESADAAMNRSRDTKGYSAFHNGRCYGLVVTVVTTNAGIFDSPVTEPTQQDWAEIKGRLEQARDSFEFLK